MPLIKRLTVQKLLGRKDPVDLIFNDDLNVIFGENGGGKTTTLKIISSALSMDGIGMHNLPVDRADIWIYSHDYSEVFQYAWERKFPRDDPRLKNMVERQGSLYLDYLSESNFYDMNSRRIGWKVIGKNQKTAKSVNSWRHAFLPATRLHYGGSLQRYRGMDFSDEELNSIFEDLIKESWMTFYSKTLANVGEIQNAGLKTILYQGLRSNSIETPDVTRDPIESYERAKGFLGRQGAVDIQILGTVDDFIERYNKDINVRRIVDTLNKIEDEVEMAMKPLKSFEKTINELFSRGKTLKTKGDGISIVLHDNVEISVGNLSSGEKHLLKILLTVMMVGNGVVLIDEPELSMHIDWQRLLINRIQTVNPGCQLIFASHSPEVMANIEDEKIFKI